MNRIIGDIEQEQTLECTIHYPGAGDSAYRVAVNNGFVGSENEWLDSLVGPQGQIGPKGDIGPQGEQGIQGPKGDAGSVKFIVTTELPTANIDENVIYMIPAKASEEKNTYEEYIYVNGAWESLGGAKVEVNLADYVKKTELENKVDKVSYNSTDGSLRGRVYVVDAFNEQTTKELRIVANADSIPLRNPNGNFYVNTPTLSFECANKGYVDNLIEASITQVIGGAY